MFTGSETNPDGTLTKGWNFHDTYYVTMMAAKLKAIGAIQLVQGQWQVTPGWKIQPNADELHNSPAKTLPLAASLQRPTGRLAGPGGGGLGPALGLRCAGGATGPVVIACDRGGRRRSRQTPPRRRALTFAAGGRRDADADGDATKVEPTEFTVPSGWRPAATIDAPARAVRRAPAPPAFDLGESSGIYPFRWGGRRP